MRVATYTQQSAPSRGSIYALSVLVMTILMGIGVLPTIAIYFGGLAERLLTPLWLLLYVSAFIGLMFTHGINWISWLVRYRILLVLLILGTILSVSWSVEAGVSAERTVHLVGSTLLAIYIGFSVPLLITLRVFAVVLAIAMLGSIGVIIALPELGIEAYEGGQVWRGLFSSKNDIGFWAATGVLLYVTLSDSTQTTYRKILCFLMAGVCLAVLPLSQSATSLMAMLVAGSLSLYLFIASRFQLGFFRMAFVAGLFIAVIALAIANIDAAELIGRSDDLTGRSEVWRQVWKLILERPLTGVGYGSLWFPTDDTIWIQQSLTDFTWVVYHAHNGLLQVASEVGIPLALIALLMVAQQLIEIFYCQYERQQVGVLFVLAFVVAYLISNYSEARFLVTRELFWIFFLALPISMLRQVNLVSVEPGEETDAYADAEPATPYGPIPGKPWLGPLPHQLRQHRDAQVSAAVGGGAALLAHVPDGDRSFGGVTTGERGRDASSGRVDVDLAGEAPAPDEQYSGAGALPDPDPRQGLAHDETHDLTDADALSAVQNDINELRAPIEHDSLRYDDSLDVDRYDMEFDLSSEWVDIDLDDDDDEQAR